MKIEPRTTPIREKRILTYDLEWYPETYQLRVAGCYDGERYQWWPSVSGFLESVLTKRNDGAWFYAHFGGAADMVFLLEWFAEYGEAYEVSAAFSGSAANVVRVKRGRCEWVFLDSFWLMRTSLAKIGDWIGVPKLECAFDAPLPELVTYNERDCVVLYRAIRAFESVIRECGGDLRMTAASTALDVFLRRFLRRPIETHPSINETCRQAYQASRVEPIRPRCEHAKYYDFNSSFPASMARDLPGSLVAQTRGRRDPKRLNIVEAEVEVSPGNYFPPLPYRTKEERRVFFPTGRWRSWFTDIDLDLLESSGGTIHKLGQGYAFERRQDMAEFAHTFFDLRLKGTGFEREVYKIVANSAYGKFAESEEKEGIVIHPESTAHRDDNDMIMPGVWVDNRTVKVRHMHVPFSAWITSDARASLYRACVDSLTRGDLYYLDTDSLVTTADMPTGSGLGELKLEYEIEEGQFLLPKLYAIRKGEDWTIKAKGFDSRAMSYEDFIGLAEGRERELVRMMRARELIRSGDLSPRDKHVSKGLRWKARPKRCIDEEANDSRPWEVRELVSR